MKTKSILITLTSCAILGPIVTAQTTLFADTFDRADSRDIDAELTGVTENTGSSLTADGFYVHGFVDPNNDEPTTGDPDGDASNGGGAQILSNELELADGPGTSNAYINHNFINPEILTNGAFTVSVDITGLSGSTADQGGGFAIGMSQAEADLTGDALNGNPNLSKMTDGIGTNAAPAVSDFWLVLRGDGTLKWGTKGNDVGTSEISVGSETGTISTRFTLSDLNDGSTVNYDVFYDGISQGSGSFTWSGTDENYIGLDARDGQGVFLDNLLITTDTATSPPDATFTATPDTVSAVIASNPVTLDWSTTNAPLGATYEILDALSTIIDSGPAAASGSLNVNVDGTAGDASFTFNLLDSGSNVLVTRTADITAIPLIFTSSQSAVRFDETSTSESLTITIDNQMGIPAGATYEISDSGTPGIVYNSPTSGTIAEPLTFDITLDPSQGSTTFTVLLKDSGGNTFETLIFNADAVPAAPATTTTLFADNFDRFTGNAADDTDIDSSTSGMSGTAPTPAIGSVYEEVWEGSNTTTSLAIGGFNSLEAASGFGMSAWFLNHNYIDSIIGTDGGFSVAFDVMAIDSVASEPGDRYCGFGIGCSASEAAAFNDENGLESVGPRGSVVPKPETGRGTSDFYCSVSREDKVQMFANGVLVLETPVDGDNLFGDDGTFSTAGVSLRTDFAFADPATFSAGSFVYYQTYVNGLRAARGYFQLTNDAENYIGFSCRASAFGEIDNLQVATVSVPYPGDPANTTPVVSIENFQYDTGNVIAADLNLSGAPGVHHVIPISGDLETFLGVAGSGLSGSSPSASLNGTTDGSGNLSFPAYNFPAGFETSGFARGDSVHWPAP